MNTTDTTLAPDTTLDTTLDTTTTPDDGAIVDFTSGGMLASVRYRGWTALVSDKNLSAAIAAGQGAEPEAIKASHELFPTIGSGKGKIDSFPELTALSNHRATVSNATGRILMPWSGSTGYFTNAKQREFYETVDELQETLLDLKRPITPSVYEDRIAAAAFLRKGFFDRSQYPSREAMLDKFSLEVFVHEVPAGDYRNTVCADARADQRREFERTMRRRIDIIQSEMSSRLIQTIQSVIHGCGHTPSTRKDGTTYLRQNRLVETTYEALLGLADTIGQLNPTKNAALESARLGLLAALTPNGSVVQIEALRDSETLRAQVKAQLESVLDQFVPAAPLLAADEIY